MSNDEGIPNDQVRDTAESEFWFGSFNIVREEPSGSAKYDLEERTGDNHRHGVVKERP